ncbi:protease Do-like 7 [Iris pallida]|uniref:Protease Do-like 7 n=1 Tax=Iris pallida TaxID=29817 RepID=A0AAX6DP75_IRIPA|nr:protease Do-like 7 [Iris pallida]
MVRHVSPVSETGMLVVDSVVPGGPAHKHLEPGDVLVHVNGEVVSQFLKLETLLDDSVGKEVDFHIERGGISLTIKLMVQDLHSITPNHFLEISGAVILPLSYQQARNFRFNTGLVYVSQTGYMLYRAGVPRHAIIKKFDGEEISKLDDLISVLAKLQKGARVPLEYVIYTDRHRNKSVLVTMDRHEWYAPPQIYTRNDCTGFWNARPAIPPGSPLLASKLRCDNTKTRFATMVEDDSSLLEHKHEHRNKYLDEGCFRVETNVESNVDLLRSGEDSNFDIKTGLLEDSVVDGNILTNRAVHQHDEPSLKSPSSLESSGISDDLLLSANNASLAEQVIERTLVICEVHVPLSCLLDGIRSQQCSGTGVIIYHSETLGLAAVDRNTVTVSASDVMLSFAAFPIEIPGEVVFMHPVHNYALVAYDPSALGAGASIVCAAELLPEPALRQGDSVYLVGLNGSLRVTSRKSIVTNPCTILNIGSSKSPRYRATNMEVIELDTDFGSNFSGVLTDAQGRVQALWPAFLLRSSVVVVLWISNFSEVYQFMQSVRSLTRSSVMQQSPFFQLMA